MDKELIYGSPLSAVKRLALQRIVLAMFAEFLLTYSTVLCEIRAH